MVADPSCILPPCWKEKAIRTAMLAPVKKLTTQVRNSLPELTSLQNLSLAASTLILISLAEVAAAVLIKKTLRIHGQIFDTLVKSGDKFPSLSASLNKS